MIVLVESNFVLELAFQQEESESAEAIVAHARAGRISLVVPAYALVEPYETLVRRRKERNTTLEKLRNELNQIMRSRAFEGLADTSRTVTEALAQSATSEANSLQDTVRRLVACADVPPLSRAIIERAFSVQAEFELQPQDAVVFASVEQHLAELPQRSKLFINKNHKDFLRPDIVEHFERSGCKLLPRISSSHEYIESTIAAPG